MMVEHMKRSYGVAPTNVGYYVKGGEGGVR